MAPWQDPLDYSTGRAISHEKRVPRNIWFPSVHKILCLCRWQYFGSSLAIVCRIEVYYLCVIFTHNFPFLGLVRFQEHSFTCLEAVYNFPRGCWRVEHHCWCCASAANQGCPLPPWALQHSTAAAHTSAAAGHGPWCTKRWREMEEASPGPQQGTECALLETCSVRTDLCSSACHWSCAFGRPCVCSMAGPFP